MGHGVKCATGVTLTIGQTDAHRLCLLCRTIYLLPCQDFNGCIFGDGSAQACQTTSAQITIVLYNFCNCSANICCSSPLHHLQMVAKTPSPDWVDMCLIKTILSYCSWFLCTSPTVSYCLTRLRHIKFKLKLFIPLAMLIMGITLLARAILRQGTRVTFSIKAQTHFMNTGSITLVAGW